MKTKFDGLSEFVTRKCRMKLLEILINEFESKSKVAEYLGISRSTISGWLNERDRHPSNSSLNQILELAFEADPEKSIETLESESHKFERAILDFVRRGANKRTNETA